LVSSRALFWRGVGAGGLGKPLLALPIFALSLVAAIISQGGDVFESMSNAVSA